MVIFAFVVLLLVMAMELYAMRYRTPVFIGYNKNDEETEPGVITCVLVYGNIDNAEFGIGWRPEEMIYERVGYTFHPGENTILGRR